MLSICALANAVSNSITVPASAAAWASGSPARANIFCKCARYFLRISTDFSSAFRDECRLGSLNSPFLGLTAQQKDETPSTRRLQHDHRELSIPHLAAHDTK